MEESMDKSHLVQNFKRYWSEGLNALKNKAIRAQKISNLKQAKICMKKQAIKIAQNKPTALIFALRETGYNQWNTIFEKL